MTHSLSETKISDRFHEEIVFAQQRDYLLSYPNRRRACSFAYDDIKRKLLSSDGADMVIHSNREPRQHIVDPIGHAYRRHNEFHPPGIHATEYAKNPKWSRKALQLRLMEPDNRPVFRRYPFDIATRDIRQSVGQFGAI